MKPLKTRTSVIILVLVMCVVLYVAGVFSGLYANKITEQRTESSLSLLKQETQEDIASLRTGTEGQIEILNNYITFLETNMNTVQLQQEFLSTIPDEETCAFSALSMNHLIEQLQFYRDKLPYRLEAYERDNPQSEEYQLLKQQYNVLSIRTWVYARDQYARCEADTVHGLYFYSADCTQCIQQGEELDVFSAILEDNLMLFTVDADADEPMIEFLKQYYNVTALPAVVLNDEIHQGRVFTATELPEAIA